ncbi:MAG: leucine-rich repeat domain-containing protein [Muribaculum sp.]|nr:leucine-rich repeat domain-containing protein [Muribaculum sp.]
MTFELEIKDGILLRPILSDEVEANHSYSFEVIIPEGVEEIADDAFFCVAAFRITKLHLPKTLRRIGNRAFKNTLSDIHFLTLPPKLEFIGDEAFFCDSLGCYSFVKKINIPDSVKYLGTKVFFGFEKLETLTIGKGITHIGEGLVGKCMHLQSIIAKCPETKAEENALQWRNKLLAVWGDLKSYTVSPEIEEIGDWAFSSCHTDKSLFGDKYYGPEEVKLPNGLRRIGDFAFHYLRIRELHIPDSVEHIGLNPINFCSVGKLSGKFTYDGRAIIVGNHLRSHIWRAESSVIPPQVEILDELAFNNFRKPKSITIPPSVKFIGKECFFMATIEELIFSEGLEKIDDEAFRWCDGLKSITFPASLKELGSETFGCATNLTKIIFKSEIPPKFPDSVISDENFKGIIRVPAESVEAYRLVFPNLAKPVPAYPNGRILKIKTS